jgi:hypothetical protein
MAGTGLIDSVALGVSVHLFFVLLVGCRET